MRLRHASPTARAPRRHQAFAVEDVPPAPRRGSARRARRRAPGFGSGRLAAAVLGGSLLGLVLRLALFVLGARLVAVVGQAAAWILGFAPSVDPVYTQAALHSLTDLHLQGVAIAGPLGETLHAHFPHLVVDPARAQWAPVRIVAEPGSPVLARLGAAAVAHAGVLGIGLLLVRRGWRHPRRPALVAMGLAVQVQVALGILGARPSLAELQASGADFAANALLPWLVDRRMAAGDALAAGWPPVMAAILVGLALLVAYLPTGVLLLPRSSARRITVGTAALVVSLSAACAGFIGQDAVAASAPVASATLNTPAAPLLVRNKPLQHDAHVAGAAAPLVAAPIVGSVDRWFAEPDERASAPPSHVEVVGSAGAGRRASFQYLVNGQPQVIKGMGLNTQYSSQLDPAERAARLDADMASMAELGVNTVLGWDPAEFDGVLLDAAERHGIGVVVPFDLDPAADYTDPAVRQDLRQQVLAWVAQYRTHPALRMWGLGNEVLHKIVHPAWVGPQDPHREVEAEAFADWLIDTADAIHAVDPDHPVTYRSAEDAFVDWVIGALDRRGGGPRPWFVWGTNCYQAHLADIVDHWPDLGMPTALWVSEFAPGGQAVPDRPDGFARMWGYIRRNPDWVLGGAVYAWTRNGPEGVDRTFGLTDDGQPVDGSSLDMLSTLFHQE